ncbi:hypothetical protein PanWU01x14_027460 [Parasponia andersonii]|uniref:Uncharacterized protein n=1 Tax=Parasponia andersonii TaxID=3476 RepID=A0A2P5DWD2_PARAD|nr:hypothetical protein PanWU01x14_027460 [Parasponia andersonii]
MDGLRESGGITLNNLVMALEKIPNKRDRANIIILKPLKPMEEGTRLGIDNVRGEDPILGMGAVVQDHGGPVLSGVDSLDGAVHFGGLLRGVIVLNAHNGVLVINQLSEFVNVGEVKKIAVDEHSPALVIGQRGGQEASEGELGTLELASLAPIEAILPQIRLFDGVDLHGDGTTLQYGVATDLVRNILARIVTDKDFQWMSIAIAIAITSGDEMVRVNLPLLLNPSFILFVSADYIINK